MHSGTSTTVRQDSRKATALTAGLLGLALLGLALLGAGSPGALAGEPLRETEQAESNFAFAHRLGSGVYEISGRTVQIYRLPLAWEWRKAEGESPGIAVTLPVTVGFFGFKVQDVIETGLPEDISTLSFVPGLRLDLRRGEHWRFRPFAEAGVASDRSAELRSTVFSVGTDAEWRGPVGSVEGRYFGSLVYSRASIQNRAVDDYALLVNGVEFTHVLDQRVGNRRLDIAPYAALRWYANPPAVPVLSTPDGARAVERLQGEFGFTLGTTEPLRIGRVTLPRLGFGYRFGEDLSVFRLVIGDPF
jgi:hypothetical protein